MVQGLGLNGLGPDLKVQAYEPTKPMRNPHKTKTAQGLGFRVSLKSKKRTEFRVQGLGFRVWGLGFHYRGKKRTEFRVQGLGTLQTTADASSWLHPHANRFMQQLESKPPLRPIPLSIKSRGFWVQVEGLGVRVQGLQRFRALGLRSF